MAIVPPAPDTDQQLCYLLPEFINLSLPNARFSSHQWIRRNGTQQMTITAGSGTGPDHADSFIPYGKYARAALVLLCTEAVRTGDPIISISKTYRGFMKQLGLGYNQANAVEAVRQMQALAASTIAVNNTIEDENGEIDSTTERYVISSKDRMIFTADHSGELSEKKESTIELSADFMRMVATSGRVPVRTDVWMHLLRNSRAAMTLDIYVWLAYRLHHLKAPARISWEQLRQQFGSDAEMKSFTQKFRKALAEALEVYPEAQVSEFGSTARGGTHGIMLKMSQNARDSVWIAP
ncbi:hypothetical protein IWX65_002721 [Arthrobacter sp. CAN_A214]|uniref:replication protein RepA n=1 Tax=Arthrobacter sp. CAN_A214 TaxID=2787720 RepID=UPI0018CA0110